MFELLLEYSDLLWDGLIHTLFASAVALVLSLILGTLMGSLQLMKHRVVRSFANAFVEFFRNIPLLIIVMFFYVAVPLYWFQITGFQAGVVGLTLYTSAYVADNVRAGILAVKKGQREAGLSTGLTNQQVMRYIVLPQAFRITLPALGNQFINLVKNSSIIAMFAGMDLMYYGDLIAMETFNTFGTYVLIGIIYLFITVPLTIATQKLEKYLQIDS